MGIGHPLQSTDAAKTEKNNEKETKNKVASLARYSELNCVCAECN